MEPMDGLLPECYGDTLLVEMLVKHEANHQKGISSVLKTMESKFKDRKAIGIIDDDKVKYTYYNEFTIKVSEDEYYRHVSHPNKKHDLIILKKDLEHFLIASAELADVKHKYLASVNILKKHSKSINPDNDFKNLINTLIQKKAKPLMEIQDIILKIKSSRP
jgi:hypothetical protein